MMICIIIGKIINENTEGVTILLEKTDFIKQLLDVIRKKAPNTLHSTFLIPIWYVSNLASINQKHNLCT
jgi:hypothetical protein